MTEDLDTVFFLHNPQFNLFWCSKVHEQCMTTLISERPCILGDQNQNHNWIAKILWRDIKSLHNVYTIGPSYIVKGPSISWGMNVRLPLGKTCRPMAWENETCKYNNCTTHGYGSILWYEWNCAAKPLSCELVHKRKRPSNQPMEISWKTPTQIQYTLGRFWPFKKALKGGWPLLVPISFRLLIYTGLELTRSPDDVHLHCWNFISWVEQNIGFDVKRVHNDDAHETVGMEKDLKWLGIILTTATLYSPQSNWLAERVNQTSMEMFRAMLKMQVTLGDIQ